MTKKEQNASPITPASKVGKLVKTNGTSEEKKIPRWNTVNIFTATQPDGSEVICGVFDGVASLLWYDLYTKAGITKTHASEVLSRLIEGVHYYTLTREEMKSIHLASVQGSWTVDFRAKSFTFLTEEGWYRAIQEIGTGNMGDQSVALNINQLKNEMASIFARYKRGEVLSIEADKMIESLPADSQEIKIANVNLAIANSFIKYACPHLKIDPGMVISASLSHAEQEIQKIGGNTSLVHLKSMIPRTLEGEPASLTVTEIGKPFGLSGNRINEVLERIGYQIHEYKQSSSGRQKKEWKPTKLGEPHGEWKPVTQGHANGSVHHEYRWYWKESIIPIIRDALFGASEAQQVLA